MTDKPRKRGRPPLPARPPKRLLQPKELVPGAGKAPVLQLVVTHGTPEKLAIYAERHGYPTPSAAHRAILDNALKDIEATGD